MFGAFTLFIGDTNATELRSRFGRPPGDEREPRVLRLEDVDLKWRAPLGYRAGPMAVASDRLLIGTTTGAAPRLCGVLKCVNRFDGQLLWSAKHPRRELKGHDITGLVRSRPCVDSGCVYYISNRGELLALDLEGFRDHENDGPYTKEPGNGPTDADTLWMLDFVDDLGVTAFDGYGGGNPTPSPLVIDDIVYSVTGNGCAFFVGDAFGKEFVPRVSAPSFVAVDSRSGTLRWTSSAPGRDLLFTWASPFAMESGAGAQVVFPGGDGRLYGFDSRGQPLWRFDCNAPTATEWSWERRGTRNFFVANPVADDNTLFVALNQDTEAWPEAAPLYALDAQKLSTDADPVVWKFEDPLFEWTYGSVAIGENSVYAFSDANGILFSIDRETGDKRWQSSCLGRSAAGFASPVRSGMHVFVLTESALHLFRDSCPPTSLGRLEFGKVVNGSPLIVDNTVYVALSGELLAIDLNVLKRALESPTQ